MADAAHRRLLCALLASLLAHAAALVAEFRVLRRPSAMAVQPLVAMIVDRDPVPAQFGAATQAAAAPPDSRRRAGGERAATVASQRSAAPERLAPKPSLLSAADASRATQARPSPAPLPAPPAMGTATASGVGSAAPAASARDSSARAPAPLAGISADDLRQYRIDLASASRRFKLYPALARERGWEGRVEVAVSVSAWQPRPQFSLARSSGHATLDRQAVAMLEQASADTTLPAGLRGRDFRILLPVEFTLDDAR
ncbi:MAG: hypothetical protein AW08_01056 [Candidatus Accumulibacter adjunctus]|uniref:TonB C-terminal domain-containing protein n=1 Tax=Candidatus Accumulibacter adjunctus TaxID=1454001 RepID=A0A011PQY3_9PROT|nr:MAG: hypothetical protein AW08_01056 [Candidatus Accumulibacter adjunctus]